MPKLHKTDDQWRQELSEEQYRVLRTKSTEAPGSGSLTHNTKTGSYSCAACGQQLFSSNTKFDSGSGWPSFYDALPGSVELHQDNSHGMVRTEIACSNCGGHLGHVFADAVDQPGGQRFCVSSVSLQFEPTDKQ